MDYIEVNITFDPLDPWRDIGIAMLDTKGFDGFTETKTGLKTYIGANSFSEDLLEDVMELEGAIRWSKTVIPEQNWNASWESNFEPVFVEDKLAILAPFHENTGRTEMTIQIQPQMSFGTGHHQTTWLMARKMFDLGIKGKSVLDMGTGTGILAILAEKRGARPVLATDIDEWAVKNTLSNIEANGCQQIKTVHGGIETLKGTTFDIVLANINKNTLVEHFSVYSKVLHSGGILLISGFFSTDCQELIEKAKNHLLIHEDTQNLEEWAMLTFKKD